MNTVNRRPRLVNTPTSKQIQTQYFHQNEWKGICEDKNTFGVDQNTFAECENVYVDRDNVLSNRPGLINKLEANNSYKIYKTKSYIIYFGQNSKIIDVNKSIINVNDLSLSKDFNENDLYFYEIGNELFAFGMYNIYKLSISFDSYSLTYAKENVFVPTSGGIKNLLCYNSMTNDVTFTADDYEEIKAQADYLENSNLNITVTNGDNVVNTSSWPYEVEKLKYNLIRNIETISEAVNRILYINNRLYYIKDDFCSVKIQRPSSGFSLEITFKLYDKNNNLIHYQAVVQNDYTFKFEIKGNEYLYNYTPYISFVDKNDNVLYFAIGGIYRKDNGSNATPRYSYHNYNILYEINISDTQNFVATEKYNTVDSTIYPLVPYQYENALFGRLVPLCIGKTTNSNHQEIICTVCLVIDRTTQGEYLYYLQYCYSGLEIIYNFNDKSWLPTPVNTENLQSKEYLFLSNSMESYHVFVTSAGSNTITFYTNGYNNLGEMRIFENSEMLGAYKDYNTDDTDIKVQLLQNNVVKVFNFKNLMYEVETYTSSYPLTTSERHYYKTYSLTNNYSEPEYSFGTINIPKSVYIKDVWFSTNVQYYLLSDNKLLINDGSSTSELKYRFYYSEDFGYTFYNISNGLPSNIRPIGTNSFLIFVNDTSYILQVTYNNKTLKLFVPEGKENKYYDTVIDAEQTSDKSLVVIGNNVLYSVVDTGEVDDKLLPIFQYIQSKLNLRPIENSDSIIAYNSTTLLMPTYNGIAAVNYSQLISVEEQTVNYITDNIMTHWFRYVASEGFVKTCNHNYYLFVYHTERKDLYMFDYRTNTWWYWTFDKNIKLIHTIGLYCFVVFEDNTLHYFDEKVLDAQWSITSQKLHLGNNTNYKQIRRFTIHTIGEKSKDYSYQSGDGDNVMTLQFTNYRKRMYENDDETFNFNVDFVRTYVIRLNYPKVYEFQYTISSNKLNLKPLQLTGLTIEYKFGGKVR